MKDSEAQQVLKTIKSLLEMNTDGIVHAIYKGRSLDSIMLGNVTASKFLSILKGFITKIDESIRENKGGTMSFHDLADTKITLESKLNEIHHYLSQRVRLEDWYTKIIWLDEYGIRNGLWDENHIVEIDNANSKLLIEKLRKDILELNNLHKHLESIKIDITHLNAQQRREAENLKEIQVYSSQSLGEINISKNESISILNIIKESHTQVDENKESFKNNLEDSNKIIHDLNSVLANTKEIHEQKIIEIENLNKTFEDTLSNARKKEDNILNKENKINELIGLAGNAALGGVFGKRKEELNTSVTRWAWASFISFVLALCWISYVLKDYTSVTITSANWLILIVNFFRTTPAVALVYFCLSQYTKERNLQEEYSFKAATAMTVTSYSEMIKSEEERIKMLVSIIAGIYTPPSLTNYIKPVSLESKDITESSKNLSETMKSVQAMLSDALKAAKPADKS